MAINRLSTGSDATWCRAWVIDTTAEVVTFLATFVNPNGPRRGDMILNNEVGQLFIVTNGGSATQLTGLAGLPIDLTSDVTGTLPVTNGGTGINSVDQGDILFGSGPDAYNLLPKDTNATRYLSNTGTDNNPVWDQVSLTNGVIGVLLTANGGTSVDIASAALPLGSGQITFPATANPSSNANTLDDYEEGGANSWTPADGSGAGLSFTISVAEYMRIGQLVQIAALITYPVTADVSNAIITGVPFTSRNSGGNVYSGTSVTGSGLAFDPIVGTNSIIIAFRTRAGGIITNVQLSGQTLSVNILYRAAT